MDSYDYQKAIWAIKDEAFRAGVTDCPLTADFFSIYLGPAGIAPHDYWKCEIAANIAGEEAAAEYARKFFEVAKGWQPHGQKWTVGCCLVLRNDGKKLARRDVLLRLPEAK